MSYEWFVMLPSLLLALISMRSLCLILDLRFPRTYVVLFLAAYVFDCICVLVGAPPQLRVLFMNPLSHIVLPLACSRGKLRSRFIRVATIWLLDPVAELSGFATFMLLGDDPNYQRVDASNALHVAITYLVAISLYALVCEAAITFFRHRDDRVESGIASPVLLFLLISPLNVYYPLLTIDNNYLPLAMSFVIASYGLSAGYAFLVLRAANNDLRLQQDQVNETAVLRQTRHVLNRIRSHTTRTADMRRLRHDLANQLEVVTSLVNSGHTDEASRYLEALEQRASALAGEQHE